MIGTKAILLFIFFYKVYFISFLFVNMYLYILIQAMHFKLDLFDDKIFCKLCGSLISVCK